jgi:hypothetical protein
VRGPRRLTRNGTTPGLDGNEFRKPIDAILTDGLPRSSRGVPVAALMNGIERCPRAAARHHRQPACRALRQRPPLPT